MPLADRKIWVINDHATLNARYRSRLIEILKDKGYHVENIGLFHPSWTFPVRVLKLVLFPPRYAISSNLRSNLVVLAVPRLRGLVILNGLGRHRRRKFLRLMLVAMIRRAKKKSVAVQCYADYRYFRRFASDCVRLAWVPGSGGTIKETGTSQDRYVAVQRDSKLPLVAKDLRELIDRLEQYQTLELVGCNDRRAAERILSAHRVNVHGTVPSDAILHAGAVFVQPSGYGEGFSHSLADAIVSEMRVLVAKREYIRSGLYKLTSGSRVYGSTWVQLQQSRALRDRVMNETTNQAYASLFEDCL